MGSGLGQALAFVRAENRTPELLQQLGDWVLDKRMHPDSNREIPSDRALLEVIINGTAKTLRRATDEVLAYLQWLNRFAEAEGLTEENYNEPKSHPCPPASGRIWSRIRTQA